MIMVPKALKGQSLLRRIPRAERNDVAELIRGAITEEHHATLRADIEADPDGWSAVYHFGGGKDVRNLLRFSGFGEKWARLSRYYDGGDVVLDQVWAPLVELAMLGDGPRPDRQTKVVRSPAELRWRARRRAYVQAAVAARSPDAEAFMQQMQEAQENQDAS